MDFPEGADMKPPEESLSSSGGFFIWGYRYHEVCIPGSFLTNQGVENEKIKFEDATLKIKEHIYRRIKWESSL